LYHLFLLFVNSTATDDSAYKDKDEINLVINASGNTGFDSDTVNVSVSIEAVEYDIEVITPDGLEIKHGSEETYQFIIRNKNKGFIADTYYVKVTSENNFSLSYDSSIGTTSNEIGVYDEDDNTSDEVVLNVTVSVPWYTGVSSDKLIFNITSIHSGDYNTEYFEEAFVTTTVIAPNILESIYHLFERVANKVGITGQYAGWVAIAVAILLLIVIIIIISIIRKRKFVELICLERIKDITPDETAVFEITVKNPYKGVLTYAIDTNIVSPKADNFEISIGTTQVVLEPGQSQKMSLRVKPTDYVKKGDWIEVKVVAKATDKDKSSEISTVTTIKDAEIKVDITGVFHWPRNFKKGDRVETSFKLFNRGNVSARNVSVVLYVNGEEKNKVEDITIPRGGYADIAIPWIAVKGKNEVYIVVN